MSSTPSQPRLNEVYEQASNPTSKNPEEVSSSSSISGPQTEIRKPDDVSGHAMPSSLGYGASDGGGDREDELGAPSNELDGEQMRAPGEGAVYNAQQHKTGFGEQEDLVADLDRKREEQDRIKEERGTVGADGGVDVKGAVEGEGKGLVGLKSGNEGSAVGVVDEMGERGVGGGL